MFLGMALAPLTVMEFICQHCDEVVTGEKYRVISEENGLVFLNMVVCQSCQEQAKQLGLRAERIIYSDRSHSRHSPPADRLMVGHSHS
jgi:RNase P subunit RPR2